MLDGGLGLMDNCAIIQAGDLCSKHLGLEIRFVLNDERRKIERIVTAELRQLYAMGDQVTVHYGEMAERESMLDVLHPVMINPPDDIIDIEHLRFEGINYGDY